MSDLNQRIEQALEEIRPYLKSDGGDIELVGIENNTFKVQLLGSCVGCSVNQMTLKQGVELTVKKYAPEIKEVVSVD